MPPNRMRLMVFKSSVPLILGFFLCALGSAQTAPVTGNNLSSHPPVASSNSPLTAVKPSAAKSVSEEAEISLDPASLLPDLPALPPAKATLVGGTVERMDRVRDQITLQVFGGGRMKILFDPRTHIYRDGTAIGVADIKAGDRVSVDTMLDGSSVFARNIRLSSATAQGESDGIIVAYHAAKRELVLRDALLPEPLKLHLTPDARIVQGNKTLGESDLLPGALVSVRFVPGRNSRDLAREVSILAQQGASFTFAGRVISLDLHKGLIVLNSSTDHKNYEVYFDPVAAVDDQLHEGSDVSLVARYDGNRYVSREVTVIPQPAN